MFCTQAESNGELLIIGESFSICRQPAHWADVLKKKEVDLWPDLSRENDLDYVRIRKFIISVFGNAFAYQQVPDNRHHIYDEVHKKVHQHVRELYDKLRTGMIATQKR